MAKHKKIMMSRDNDLPSSEEIVDAGTGLVSWGKDNLRPQFLNYLYYTCAVHQGIINRKVAFILGKGLKETESNKEILKIFNPILRSVLLNNELSDSYYVKFRLDYTDKTKIEHAEILSFETVRANTNGTYTVCEDWTDNSETRETLRTYKNMSEDDQSFIYAYKNKPLQYLLGGQGKKLSKAYYPEPSYSGGIKSILTDIEAVDYQYSSFRNSFAVGTIVNMNNGTIPDPKDKRSVIEDIEDNATGSENASGVLVFFNNGKETEVTVQQLSGDQLHERYSRMSEDVRDNMLKAHGVISPSLFGFQSGGSFNQSEMDIAYILMKDDYFAQRQDAVLECVNFADKINGGLGEIEFEDFNPLNEIKQSYNFKESKKKEKEELTNERVVAEFSKYGEEVDRDNFVFSESLNIEEPFKEVFGKFKFSDLDIQVLKLIEDGNTFDKIYQALGIKPMDLAKIYKRLTDGEKLADGKLTKGGKLDIVKSDVAKYEIRYTYEVKAGFGAEIIEGSRDLCRDLIGLNRMYSREDIDNISRALGMDSNQLWRYRGGWYTHPKGSAEAGRRDPACRHEWVQSLRYVK